MNTKPFQAMGDAGTDSPFAGSAMVVVDSWTVSVLLVLLVSKRLALSL